MRRLAVALALAALAAQAALSAVEGSARADSLVVGDQKGGSR